MAGNNGCVTPESVGVVVTAAAVVVVVVTAAVVVVVVVAFRSVMTNKTSVLPDA